MSDRTDFGAFLIGFVVGGLTGAAVALLMAPQTGEETRTLIKEKSIELKDKAEDTYEDVYKRAEVLAADVKVKAGEVVKDVRTTAEDVYKDVRVKAGDLTSRGQVVLDQQKAKAEEVVKKVRKSEPKQATE